MILKKIKQTKQENDKRENMWRPTAEDLPHSPSGQMIVQTWTAVLATILLGLQQVRTISKITNVYMVQASLSRLSRVS